MKAIAKLKDRARKHEQKEDWQAAIDAYQQILEAEESEDSIDVELGLYNRIGDLYLRLGQTDDAVTYYESAADKYAESGFFNNAIALCNKALRHRPDRPETYLKLSRLCAEQGFVPDARRWIIDYAERQVKRGAVDGALEGLAEFADSTGDPDVRELMAQHLAGRDRGAEAVDQLRLAYATRLERGESDAAERVAAQAAGIDPSVDLAAEAPATPAPAGRGEEAADPAAPLPMDEGEEEATDEAAGALPGLEGLETHRQSDPEPEPAAGGGGLEGLEATRELDSLEAGESAAPADEAEAEEALAGAGADPIPEGIEPEPEEEPEPLPMLDTGFDEEDEAAEEAAEPLPMLDTGFDDAAPGEPAGEEAEVEEEVAGLDLAASFESTGPEAGTGSTAGEEAGEEAAGVDTGGLDLDFGAGFDLGIDDDAGVPEGATDDLDVESVLQRARELVSRGLTAEALRELRLLSGTRAPAEVFAQAVAVTNEIVRHDADDVRALQARAELAARTGDREMLVDAFLDLAEGLDRLGAEVKSRAMFQRVLDLDPENETARERLGVDRAAAEEEEAVDLDAILREMAPDAGVAASRGAAEPAEEGLATMLSNFKARVADQPTSDDAGDHYDLGLAFKEMGLIDEAIAEFQTALTGGEERLKVYEELGQCFIQKGQFNVAIKVFNRAIQAPRQDDADLLGVYYHLGQCHEELGQRAEARSAYEKVLEIDPEFSDVSNRVARL